MATQGFEETRSCPGNVPSAWPPADPGDPTLAFGRAICDALAIYYELRRTRATSSTMTPAHPPHRRVGSGSTSSTSTYPRLDPRLLDHYLDHLLEHSAARPGAPAADAVTAGAQLAAGSAGDPRDFAAQPAERGPGAGHPAGQPELLQQAMLRALVLTTQRQCQDADATTTAVPLPAYIRRAVNAVHADPAHPYTVVSLAQLAGVKVRTLQQGFRSQLGTSPMSYLRDVRLTRAHEDLVGGSTSGVAEVAYRWGFTHLGRFAAAYAAQYGESPSQTRNRQPLD